MTTAATKRTESTASIIDRTKRCAEAARQDYRNDGIKDGKSRFSIDLNLNERDQISLSVALREALDKHGVAMMHDKIVSQPAGGFHPDSHVGVLVDLYRRVDAALHGRKTWNRGR